MTGPVAGPNVESHDDGEVQRFWSLACHRAKLTDLPGYLPSTSLEVVPPPAWSFGATPEQADELLELVLAGTKTATASALWDYEAEDEPLPEAGALGIVLDSRGHPRALVETTAVEVVSFDAVSEEHAFLEGEDDRSLASWREVHERFFGTHSAHDRGFEPDMPVVLERFRLVFGD